MAVLVLGDRMERFVREQIARSTAGQSILVASRIPATIDGQISPVDRYPNFTPADAAAIAATLPGLASQVGLESAAGRSFTPAEADSKRPVLVLGPMLAHRLTSGGPEDAVGATVRMRGGRHSGTAGR